ncbi:DUF6441 family protein [Roseococcus pinisoli]|uniref:HK97 gp10 family phage protein n=1 Tax=Roseococcus pinisoli TaxID=2835040 RepID=A0ABS5QAK1_9PROT|nr:DUF6441 family protein [Roseococcus pinisoli]MBS7810538.1 hypothetical protein [Roseococcus pinisoli]
MRLAAAISGNLRAAMEQEVRATPAALKRAVTAAGKTVQAELREQARAAGMVDGGRAVANSWRLTTFPRPGVSRSTLRPAASIKSSVPNIVDAFERAPVITPKAGRYLAIPTALNRQGGRRGAKPRVSVQQMTQAGAGAFTLPMKNGRGKLWCIRLNQAQGVSKRRGRGRMQAFAGSTGVQLYVGNRRGQQAHLRAQIERGYAVMYLLLPSVQAPKLLRVAETRRRSGDVLAAEMVRELGALPK